jgi:hypothetical protein
LHLSADKGPGQEGVVLGHLALLQRGSVQLHQILPAQKVPPDKFSLHLGRISVVESVPLVVASGVPHTHLLGPCIDIILHDLVQELVHLWVILLGTHALVGFTELGHLHVCGIEWPIDLVANLLLSLGVIGIDLTRDRTPSLSLGTVVSALQKLPEIGRCRIWGQCFQDVVEVIILIVHT